MGTIRLVIPADAPAPGLALYERFGFTTTERTLIPVSDGINIGGAAMDTPITPLDRLPTSSEDG